MTKKDVTHTNTADYPDITYMVNGRRFNSPWATKAYIEENNWIITDRETIDYKGRVVILYNVSSK